MKHTITNRLAALLLLTIGMMGCTKEETLPDTARTPMTISVTDAGYAANDKSAAQTRAVENEYTTEFTVGDQIGIYVVRSDGSYANKNIALTLAYNGDGTFAWTTPVDTKLYYEGAAARYFAYYPYQPALTGDLDPSATEAAAFFADVVSKWAPSEDQSSHARYTAQDLMVGSGTAYKQEDGTYPLALRMTHSMALVVIETPTTKYALSNDANYTWPTAAPDTKFYRFTPYSPELGTYRYLVKPTQREAPDLCGSYTAQDGKTQEYIMEQNNIAAAKYMHYKVDDATVIEKTHTLQVGDFYMEDGSLLSGNVTPTEQQKAACIGIVYWVGDATAKDKTLEKDHSGCTHGLVVAIGGDVESVWQTPYILVQEWLNSNKPDEFLSVMTGNVNEPSDPLLNNIQGYNNTKAIEAFNADAANLGTIVTAIQKVVEYRSTVPAPSSSSNWYLPSEKELVLLCGEETADIWGKIVGTTNRDLINGKLELIGGTAISSSIYWSCSEYNRFLTFTMNFDNGFVRYYNKSDLNYRVRFSLAF